MSSRPRQVFCYRCHQGAKSEGVSINQLLTAILAEGIARRAS